MIVIPEVRLASRSDARSIAQLSREYIEQGLGWRWTESRVLNAIMNKATNVAVIRDPRGLLAFGIMDYGDDTAHLALLGVHPAQRRNGLGRALVLWLEACARTMGIGLIKLEARVDNPVAVRFYETLGFHASGRIHGYYSGQLDAIRFEKHLRHDATDASD